MGVDYWFIADTHFDHENVLGFLKDDGSKLRDFNSIQEMDMMIIQNWNNVVKPQDKIYLLGDVSFSKKAMDYFKIMNGRKRLIRGNHDLFPDKFYTQHFDGVYGVRALNIKGKRFVLSHVPVHPECLDRWGVNIHGHLHANNLDDDRYINVSCEQVNYTPVNLDQLIP